MPGIDGLRLQSMLAARGVRLPVIVMTGHADVPVAVRAMKAGALDFLEKPFTDDAIIGAVRRALEDNRLALQASDVTLQAGQRLATLTPREREVLELMVTGKSNKEIAKVLGTSPRTIDVHRARVFPKLEAGSLPESGPSRAGCPRGQRGAAGTPQSGRAECLTAAKAALRSRHPVTQMPCLPRSPLLPTTPSSART